MPARRRPKGKGRQRTIYAEPNHRQASGEMSPRQLGATRRAHHVLLDLVARPCCPPAAAGLRAAHLHLRLLVMDLLPAVRTQRDAVASADEATIGDVPGGGMGIESSHEAEEELQAWFGPNKKGDAYIAREARYT